PASGEVLKISGGKSPVGQTFVGDALLRGAARPAVKFPPFESVSLQPRWVRKSAVRLSSSGAGPAPSKQFAPPYPTKSMTPAVPTGQPPESNVLLLTSASFPAVALMF